MDAQAHLLSLGWLGPGHALDSRRVPAAAAADTTSSPIATFSKGRGQSGSAAHFAGGAAGVEVGNGIGPGTDYKQKGHRGLAYDPVKVGNNGQGLVKPLAVSQRKNRFGIGKKAHEPSKGTEWWLKGFESALGNIGKTSEERGVSDPSEKRSVILAGRMGEKYGGLYGFFTRGIVMEGSIGDKGFSSLSSSGSGVSSKSDHSTRNMKKRKSDVLNGDDTESREEETSSKDKRLSKKVKKDKHKSKASRPSSSDDEKVETRVESKLGQSLLAVSPVRRPAATTAEFAAVSVFMNERDKNDKRNKPRSQPTPALETFKQLGEFFNEIDSQSRTTKSTRKNKEKDKSKQEKTTRKPDQVNGESREETKAERRERKRLKKEERERRNNGVDIDTKIDTDTDTDIKVKHTFQKATNGTSANDQNDNDSDDDDDRRKARRKERRRKRAEKSKV